MSWEVLQKCDHGHGLISGSRQNSANARWLAGSVREVRGVALLPKIRGKGKEGEIT